MNLQGIKKVSYDLFIELAAVLLAIVIAFYVDRRNEERHQMERIQNYFGLLRNELIKDTAYMSELMADMTDQYLDLDTFLGNPTAENVNKLNRLEAYDFLQSREYLFTVIQSNESFNEIYDRSVFNQLNNTVTDFELFSDMQIDLKKSLDELLEKFIYPERDYRTQQIDFTSTFSSNLFLNQLQIYNERLKSRYIALISLRKSYENLLGLLSQKSVQPA